MTRPPRTQKPTLADIRRAVADYMRSEGCGCCGDRDAHEAHYATLGKLLRVRKYSDGSGYDFEKYHTEVRAPRRKP